LVLGTSSSPCDAETAGQARKKLQGTWVAQAAQRDGKPAADVVGHRLTFTGGRFSIRSRGGKVLYEGTFEVDPGSKPAAIDFKHEKGALKGKVWKGIYSLEGDGLRTCDNAPDLARARPSSFRARAGSGYVAITFKRGKP
jgi:uncharacterized protein (TIGR03067 family)